MAFGPQQSELEVEPRYQIRCSMGYLLEQGLTQFAVVVDLSIKINGNHNEKPLAAGRSRSIIASRQ